VCAEVRDWLKKGIVNVKAIDQAYSAAGLETTTHGSAIVTAEGDPSYPVV
jgi:hypothetical protein